jgi:CRISPR-associated exonuclease Cas4
MDEDDYLLLSGIQHFCFCRRQWAQIHIEQQWEENVRTVEGNILHERAHDKTISEKRGDVITVRGMAISSPALGVSGQCDVVEFHASPDGVPLSGRKGTWLPVPVEYKRGRPKEHDADRLQLCCQAMCLEEMLCCPPIGCGYLYYGEIAHREEVLLDESLRENVRNMLSEMHALYKREYTPLVRPDKSCNACSMKEICLPRLYKNHSAAEYLDARLKEDGV